MQVLPFSDSGRSTPSTSGATLQDNPVSQQAEVIVTNNANVVVVSTPHTGNANLVETPLIEVSEEDDTRSSSEKSSSTTTLSSTTSTTGSSESRQTGNGSEQSRGSCTTANGERASSVPKDIKESRNYEKKKQSNSTKKRNSKMFDTTTNPLEQEILALKGADSKTKTTLDSNKQVKETNSVGVQVNLIQAAALSSQPSSPVPTSTCSGPAATAAAAPVTSMTSMSTASPSLARKLAHLAKDPEEINLDRHLLLNLKSNYESKTLPRRKSNNDVTR